MIAVVGLGSSLGGRRGLLAVGARALNAAPEIAVRRLSRVYWSPPAGGIAAAGFFNAAVLLEVGSSPAALLACCLAIEARLGRRRGRRWADRTLDLDVLWIEGLVVDTPSLMIPHPRLLERAFALVPLLEVAPEAVDPRTEQRLSCSPLPMGPLARVGMLS